LSEGPNVGIRSAANALEGVAAGTPIIPAGEKQDELFDLDGPEGAEGPVSKVLERKGPGRPKGSINKRTEDLRRFLLARFKHPVVALAEIYSVPTDELASALGIKAVDALTLQIRAAGEVAPYVDSKMPAKVMVTDSDRLPAFNLVFADGGVTVEQGGKRVDVFELADRAKRAMLQRLSGGEDAGSHGEGSHGEGDVIEHQ
jgi:hypothetical protein